MKSCLSVGLFYNCQPVRIGLWFNSEREFVAADPPVPKLGSSVLEACPEPVEGQASCFAKLEFRPQDFQPGVENRQRPFYF